MWQCRHRVLTAVKQREVMLTSEGGRDEMVAEKACAAKNQEFHTLTPSHAGEGDSRQKLVHYGLGKRVRPVKEEDHNLLIGVPADVHRAMHLVGWRIPVRHAGCDLDVYGISGLSKLESEGITSHNNCHPMKWINVPWRRFPWLKNQPPDECGAMLTEFLSDHFICPS